MKLKCILKWEKQKSVWQLDSKNTPTFIRLETASDISYENLLEATLQPLKIPHSLA